MVCYYCCICKKNIPHNQIHFEIAMSYPLDEVDHGIRETVDVPYNALKALYYCNDCFINIAGDGIVTDILRNGEDL
jgi:hypothetical protein